MAELLDVLNHAPYTYMQLGYLGIISLMVLSPIPPELFMPLAGFLVAQGHLNFVGVVGMGLLGFLTSILPWYLGGRLLGERRLTQLAQRYRWLALPTQDIEKGRRWFKQHGIKAVLGCLLIPGTRNLIMLPAGLSGIPLPNFLLAVTLGATVWLSGLTALGYFLGDQYHLVEQHFDSVPRIALAIILIGGAVWLAIHYRQHRSRRLKRR